LYPLPWQISGRKAHYRRRGGTSDGASEKLRSEMSGSKALASSGVGPEAKSRRTEKHQKRATSAPPIPPGFPVGDDSGTCTDDWPVHYHPPDQPDPDPPMIQSRKPERESKPRRRPREASASPSEKLGSPEVWKPTKPARVLAKLHRTVSEERRYGTIAPVPRPETL